jgi:uncharacterized membrane protein YheB (UPF0754 family)
MDNEKYRIIEELANDRTIEEIIKNVSHNSSDDTLNDLAQMLYEDLLSKPSEKIVELHNKKQIQFFLTRMVINSIKSKTSRYYYLFTKPNNNLQGIDTIDEWKI